MLSRCLTDGWIQAGSQKSRARSPCTLIMTIAHVYQVLTMCQIPFQVLHEESSQQRDEVRPINSPVLWVRKARHGEFRHLPVVIGQWQSLNGYVTAYVESGIVQT